MIKFFVSGTVYIQNWRGYLISMSQSTYFVLQSQRSSASVPPWPAERHHLCPGPKGRHHHQALAGPVGEEPAGGPSHRPQGNPPPHPVTTPASPILKKDASKKKEKLPKTARSSVPYTRRWRCSCERLEEQADCCEHASSFSLYGSATTDLQF